MLLSVPFAAAPSSENRACQMSISAMSVAASIRCTVI
jgi:hypothetical protein